MKDYQPGDYDFSEKSVSFALNEFHETGKKSDLLSAMTHKHRIDTAKNKAEFDSRNESFAKAYAIQGITRLRPLFNAVRYGLSAP